MSTDHGFPKFKMDSYLPQFKHTFYPPEQMIASIRNRNPTNRITGKVLDKCYIFKVTSFRGQQELLQNDRTKSLGHCFLFVVLGMKLGPLEFWAGAVSLSNYCWNEETFQVRIHAFCLEGVNAIFNEQVKLQILNRHSGHSISLNMFVPSFKIISYG